MPDQRRVGQQFVEALGLLERLPVPARFNINVPYELVKVGADWTVYFLALAQWILVTAPTLPDGSFRIGIPTTELECIALKDGSRPAGVFLSRPAPDDDTLPARISDQIVRKMKKLRRYKDDGHTTVLILETEDVALMNQHKMLEAVRTAVDGKMPEDLDQVWFTEARGHVFFDFTGPITTGSGILG